MTVNIVVGLAFAAVGGLIAYILIWNWSKQIINTIIVIAIISFLIGIFLNTIIATILSSCACTILVCFALNSAALVAMHPDHSQSLAHILLEKIRHSWLW